LKNPNNVDLAYNCIMIYISDYLLGGMNTLALQGGMPAVAKSKMPSQISDLLLE
jgi:hypothetical protein